MWNIFSYIYLPSVLSSLVRCLLRSLSHFLIYQCVSQVYGRNDGEEWMILKVLGETALTGPGDWAAEMVRVMKERSVSVQFLAWVSGQIVGSGGAQVHKLIWEWARKWIWGVWETSEQRYSLSGLGWSVVHLFPKQPVLLLLGSSHSYGVFPTFFFF